MDETPTHLIGMRAELMHAARADVRAGRRRRGRIRLAGVAVAAVAVIGALTVGLPSSSTGGAPQVDTSLAGVLKTASINAAGQPGLPIPTAGHYYHYTDTGLGYVSELGRHPHAGGVLHVVPGAAVVLGHQGVGAHLDVDLGRRLGVSDDQLRQAGDPKRAGTRRPRGGRVRRCIARPPDGQQRARSTSLPVSIAGGRSAT